MLLSGIKSYTRFWGLLMFGSYSVINVIVLLNLLIAMMSNSYAVIEVRLQLEWYSWRELFRQQSHWYDRNTPTPNGNSRERSYGWAISRTPAPCRRPLTSSRRRSCSFGYAAYGKSLSVDVAANVDERVNTSKQCLLVFKWSSKWRN